MENTAQQNNLILETEEQKIQSAQESLKSTLQELAEVDAAMSLMKNLYERKDALTMKLKDLVGVNNEVIIGDLIFSVVDNFETKNVVFRPTGVRRFDLNVDSQLARQIKAKDVTDKAAVKAVKEAAKAKKT